MDRPSSITRSLTASACALVLALSGCNGSGGASAATTAPASSVAAPAPALASPADADLAPETCLRELAAQRDLSPSETEAFVAATLRAFAEVSAEIDRRALERGAALDEEDVAALLEAKQQELDARLGGGR